MTGGHEEKEMLAYLGIDSVERLFDDIPKEVRIDGINLPEGLSELEARRKVEQLLARNVTVADAPSFLGSGVYDFYVPASVRALVGRAEFYTSYTPYQPETSQGYLQAMFEYQTMMSELTGMECVNNSIYDMATSLGEAALMAARISRGKRFLIPEAIDADRKSVLENYVRGAGLEIIEVKNEPMTSWLDLDDLKSKMNDNVAGVYFETPNMYGVFEELVDDIREVTGTNILVAGVNPLSLTLARPPGDYGADIVIGEGQMFGNAPNFGGPLLGIFACNKKHVRKMPGRIVGMTHDIHGHRAYCMTLQTREQHIRREKATSNICSNQALTILAAAAFMAIRGGDGLKELALDSMLKARGLAAKINALDGFEAPLFSDAHLNEFTACLPLDSYEIFNKLAAEGIIGGRPLPESRMVFSVTDTTTDEAVARLISALEVMS